MMKVVQLTVKIILMEVCLTTLITTNMAVTYSKVSKMQYGGSQYASKKHKT
ncbi:hypothetical protein [Galbibacter marinus]|uniref:hypothetical protein n=1 Tax=Galbibacter marinus TaxID=555500 RepID=UPI0012EA90D8|nr:hypothetical protein [Galbibacter marinus]